MEAKSSSAVAPASSSSAAAAAVGKTASSGDDSGSIAAVILHTAEVLFSRRCYHETVFCLQAITQNPKQFTVAAVNAATFRVARAVAADLYSRLPKVVANPDALNGVQLAVNDALTTAMKLNSVGLVKSLFTDITHICVSAQLYSKAIEYLRSAINTFPPKSDLLAEHIHFGFILVHVQLLDGQIAESWKSFRDFRAKLHAAGTAAGTEGFAVANALLIARSTHLYAALLHLTLNAMDGATVLSPSPAAAAVAAATVSTSAAAAAAVDVKGASPSLDAVAADLKVLIEARQKQQTDTATNYAISSALYTPAASTNPNWLDSAQCSALYQLLLAVGLRASSEMTLARAAQKQCDDALIKTSAAASSTAAYRSLFVEAKTNAFLIELSTTEYTAAAKILSELIDSTAAWRETVSPDSILAVVHMLCAQFAVAMCDSKSAVAHFERARLASAPGDTGCSASLLHQFVDFQLLIAKWDQSKEMRNQLSAIESNAVKNGVEPIVLLCTLARGVFSLDLSTVLAAKSSLTAAAQSGQAISKNHRISLAACYYAGRLQCIRANGEDHPTPQARTDRARAATEILNQALQIGAKMRDSLSQLTILQMALQLSTRLEPANTKLTAYESKRAGTYADATKAVKQHSAQYTKVLNFGLAAAPSPVVKPTAKATPTAGAAAMEP